MQSRRRSIAGANPTTLRMKAWLQGTGAIGLWSRLSFTGTSVPTVFAFDDFLVAP